MESTAHVTVLGSGTSHGVPMLACHCAVCRSDDPRNQRTRPCAVLHLPQGNLLIDTPPELRLQCVRFGIEHVGAVVITHGHADHLFGMDDLRGFTDAHGGHIPVYGLPDTLDVIRTCFPYAFRQMPPGITVPRLSLHTAEPVMQLLGARIETLHVWHGKWPVLGIRCGAMAWITDVSLIPEPTMDRLHGLDLLFLDAVRRRPHPTHFHLERALEVIRSLAPKRAVLIHLSHDYDHSTTNAQLPEGVELAYDGMRCTFTIDGTTTSVTARESETPYAP